MTEIPEGMVVTMADCRAADLGCPTVRAWFRLRGIEDHWQTFLHAGISAQLVWDTGCDLPRRVILHKLGRTDGR